MTIVSKIVAKHLASSGRKAAPLTEDKLQALLLKMRKGATSSVTLGQYLAVLEALGGWKIDFGVELSQKHGYDGNDNAPSSTRSEDEAEKLAEFVVPSLPKTPKKGVRYIMDLEEADYGTGRLWEYREWIGVEAIRITSPEGKTYVHKSGRYDKEISAGKIPFYGLVDWLRTTSFLNQVNAKLGMVSLDQERELAKPRTRENTGTCPCCFRNVKLKGAGNKTIVLHGYTRPGWGSVQGSCMGVGYPPFELSPAGTRYAVDTLTAALKDAEKLLEKWDRDDFRDPISTSRGTFQYGTYSWDKAHRDRIFSFESKVKGLKSDIPRLEQLINQWELRPLPVEGGRILDIPSFLK